MTPRNASDAKEAPACPGTGNDHPSVPAKRPYQQSSYNLRKRNRRRGESNDATAVSRLGGLSVELWGLVLRNMAPSQLAIVAQVSKQINAIVIQLPIWKHIATAARIGVPASRGKRKTYYGLVLANSNRICENCYQTCRRVIVYEAPLPVFLDEHNKKIHMCLPCRRAHFEKHPEPVGPHDCGVLRNYYGGQVGIDAQKRRSRQMREKRDERLEPVRNERRAFLESVFTKADMAMDDDDPEVLDFIRYAGDNEVHRRAWANRIMESVLRRRAMNRRRHDLVERLQTHGVDMQNNMSLCQAYVMYDEGHIDDVVAMTVEINWFVRETNYESLRFYTTHGHSYRRYGGNTVRYANTEHGKARALRAYVRQRLYLRRWNDVSLDENLLARPPETLWWKIRSLTKTIWLEEARDTFLAAGVHASEELLQLDPQDPSSLTWALFIRVLDRGALASTAPLTDSESTLIPFSLALRAVVGEDLFIEFIESNTASVMEMAQTLYVEGAVDNPPKAIGEFIAQRGKVTKKAYADMERTFIKISIPDIAKQEYIHPHYLVKLLEELKEYGSASPKGAYVYYKNASCSKIRPYLNLESRLYKQLSKHCKQCFLPT
ncbi:hypothetical protein BJV82DRAFT_631054 [Fennellomyces sp. T-0311]|nr:hypothetical protein BJV82DRAFT_631054 [Fennellomyces sp. T-0311]